MSFLRAKAILKGKVGEITKDVAFNTEMLTSVVPTEAASRTALVFLDKEVLVVEGEFDFIVTMLKTERDLLPYEGKLDVDVQRAVEGIIAVDRKYK